MQTQARLIRTRIPRDPAAAVLVLHGGAARRGNMMVSPTQLSVLRMIPIARQIARRGRGRLAVFRLLNSVRGWDHSNNPVADVRWALDQLAGEFGPDLPVGLVGHSLGGRAALLAGGEPPVRSVVGLAPWVYPSDVNPDLRGRQVLVVHGDRDRIASPRNSAAVVGGLARFTDAAYISVAGGKHAMLRHHRQFDGLAADFVLATLLGRDVDGPVAEVLSGARRVEV